MLCPRDDDGEAEGSERGDEVGGGGGGGVLISE